MQPDNHEHGDHLKALILAHLESCRFAYIRRGRRTLLTALCFKGTATADDVRRAVSLPDDVDPVCLGAVPLALVKAGIIEADGFEKSKRPETHARPIQRWRLVDRAKALTWLREHPDKQPPKLPALFDDLELNKKAPGRCERPDAFK